MGSGFWTGRSPSHSRRQRSGEPRMPLVAYNVNLGTDNLEIANQIARRVRNINGGYHYIKPAA